MTANDNAPAGALPARVAALETKAAEAAGAFAGVGVLIAALAQRITVLEA